MNPLKTIKRRSLLAIAAAAIAVSRRFTQARHLQARLPTPRKRGKVVIGIQGDNATLGFCQFSGVQDGLDADIGKAFANISTSSRNSYRWPSPTAFLR